MLEWLKEQVFEANMLLKKYNLVTLTWGNVSGIDRNENLVVIKPSGAPYESMRASDMVVLRLDDGKVVEGALTPSSDTPTHLELYRRFSGINGITHTHSRYATIFAQNNEAIPPFGTTHADCFYGTIPCTRQMTSEEIHGEFEKNTGKVIIETFTNIDPKKIPAVLVANHGPFTWGRSPVESVQNAATLEEIAFMAWNNLLRNPEIQKIKEDLLEKHYQRKHGAEAYYGQKV